MCSLWTSMNVILSMDAMLYIYGCDEYCDVPTFIMITFNIVKLMFWYNILDKCCDTHCTTVHVSVMLNNTLLPCIGKNINYVDGSQ
jgi:hypothetical protein